MSRREDEAKARWIKASLDQHEAKLTRYALRITHDLERAREVVQETFLKLWQADQAQIEGHLAEWLYTVCRNQALDLRRKDRRMVPLAKDGAVETPDESPTAGEQLERRQEENRVLNAFLGLTDKQQEVLRLKFQGRLSYAEISRVTGLSVSNIGYIIHTGVQALRARVAPELAVEGVSNES
jgi:RNA polymerase sigma-70 factor (ECF subfamily)